MVAGGDPFYVKISAKLILFEQNADFQSILARSASAFTPSEKTSINSNRKSTTRCPISLR